MSYSLFTALSVTEGQLFEFDGFTLVYFCIGRVQCYVSHSLGYIHVYYKPDSHRHNYTGIYLVQS